MPDARVPHRIAGAGQDETTPLRLPTADHPPLATALARSFELVAGIALVALATTALVVVLVPNSAATRASFAVELVSIGLALVVLALLLSRRSAHAVVEPLEVLDAALATIAGGDYKVRVRLVQAAAEIQFVGESVNAMVRELARLEVVEIERTKDERVRRELSDAVHASLDLDQVVQRAVEVVGAALEVDRVHIRLREHGSGRLAAEWRRTFDVSSLFPVSPDDEMFPLIHLIGVTDDHHAVVIDDALDGARFAIEQREAFAELGVHAAVKFPLIVGGGVAGVLVASDQDAAHAWSDSEVTLLDGFAREIGRALDHALAFGLQDEMVERLGVLDRAKNDFLAEVSRELRGPLASVLGYIELLTDESAEAVTPEQHRMLGIVERNGAHLLVLIEDLLTMSRMEAGTFEPDVVPVDLAVVVGRVCEAITPSATAGDVQIEVYLDPEIDLLGDEKQIELALHHLVSNAVKFTLGGGRIDVFARSEGDEIVVDVRDTGVGIARDDQDALFSRFFNARAAPKRETLGTGLGLYIVKQIVDGHGGSVGAVSTEGRGSTFTMRFPARPKPKPSALPAVASPAATTTTERRYARAWRARTVAP